MTTKLTLHCKGRKEGSYYRKDFTGDVLYYSFIYKDIHITFPKKGRKNTILSDRTADLLLSNGLITADLSHRYADAVSSEFSLETLPDFDSFSLEKLYRFLSDIRERTLGKQNLKKLWEKLTLSPALSFENCLDQSMQIERMCTNSEILLIALTEAELFQTMRAVISSPKFTQKRIVYITSERNEKNLPAKSALLNLLGQNDIETVNFENGEFITDTDISLDSTALLIFGEDGLLEARHLKIPCGIFCNPKGYHACAVTGQLGLFRPAAVYVPKNYSIVESVPVTKPTRLNYLILSKLSKAYGERIYSLTTEELYAKYPNYFFNVYESSVMDHAESGLPILLPENADSIEPEHFDTLRSQAIKRHLESFANCKYFTKTFSESEDDGIRGKILVHGVRIKKSGDAAVIPCGKTTPLRAKLREMGQKGTGILSNFLFFLTPKLATLYNNLRSDRPDEQADVDTGHLDYLLEYRDGKRIETFPLFRKTCIALKENGEFIFFNFRLGGGSIKIQGTPLSWSKKGVDPKEGDPLPEVCIFTPYSSLSDKDANRETYRKAVGADRINIVLIQEKITAIRDGDVLLPGMGVVISLKKEIGLSLCKKLKLQKNESGYFQFNEIKLELCLDAPDGIDEKEWKAVRWAYGGGLSLILDGISLSDSDHMEEWFEQDGWTSPLSRQTQESALHTIAKHPRTAIGTTKNGELVILVFSGRTEASSGADYVEMCTIAKELIPDIENLMNVDGGGSAMLGMAMDGSFTELSLPSTSTGSTVGMVRPINTVLYVPLT